MSTNGKTFSILVAAACLVGAAGCSSGDGGKQPVPAAETVRQLPPIAGTPTDAGYFVGPARLLRSADPEDAEPLTAADKQYPLAVRIEVETAAKMIPAEYAVVIDKRRYRPKGISFGSARQTFFNVEKFVADEIELTLGGSDQITTNKGGKLNGCRLEEGEVYLLYLAPGSAAVELNYDGRDYDLRPTDAAVLGVEPSTKTAGSGGMEKPAGPQGRQIEVKRGQLAIGSIDRRDTEVFELELILKSSKYESVDLHLGEDFFLAGNAPPGKGRGNRRGRGSRSNRVFVQLQEDRMRLLTGTEFFDNTYKDVPMKELVNGGVSISLEPGRPITVYFVFPNPPFENGLALHFPERPPLDVVPAGDVLGEIRPAIPRGVARIPRARIVGEPVKVHVIDGNLLVDNGGKSLASVGPGSGKRFVALRFALKGECEFVPRDYVLRDESGTSYYPEAAAFGEASAQAIPGDGYEGVKLAPGESDVVRRKKGELSFWQYARPEFLALFAIPQTLATFEFTHGDRVLQITPVAPPVTWKELRPGDTVLADGGAAKPPAAGKTKTPPAAADDAEKKARQAASQLRLGKQLVKKDAGKAREYFEEAIRLAPASDAAKEAKQLLEDLK